ncbi:MAG: lytic transglycosylase domain-containing protein [Chloroflexi bacterium]|nr:lytic transglycosylase domain-containing protein [Chloroflexota bacterium]
MKLFSLAIAQMQRRSRKLKAQVGALSARQALGWLAANLLRTLRLSRDQIRGGRAIVKREGVWYVPLWLPIAVAMLLGSSPLWDDAARIAGRLSESAIHLISGTRQVELAPFFAPAVRHWSDEINRWAARHDVDPHLLATVMQIESCGHPKVISNAGAQGLFQVMPFHFAAGEDMLDPDTNARRGASFLKICSGASDGVVGLTLACYNGGQSVISKPRERWSSETQHYFRWGVGIYSDAIAGAANSDTFDQWIAAGGGGLCASALAEVNG